MKDHGERIASLEAYSNQHGSTLGDVADQLERLNAQVSQINRKLDNHIGFLAGVAFVFTMLGAFIGMGGASLLRRMMGPL